MATKFNFKNIFRYLILLVEGVFLGLLIIGGYGGFFESVIYFDGKPITQYAPSQLNSSMNMTSISFFNVFGYLIQLNGNYTLAVLIIVALLPILLDKLIRHFANK